MIVGNPDLGLHCWPKFHRQKNLVQLWYMLIFRNYFLILFHISLAAAMHLSVMTNFWVSCGSLKVCLRLPYVNTGSQGCHNLKNKIFDIFIFFVIFVRFLEDARQARCSYD